MLLPFILSALLRLIYSGAYLPVITGDKAASQVTVAADTSVTTVAVGQYTITMYTSRKAETDNTPCTSADGSDICKLLVQGEITCASNDYKFGTLLKLDGLGTCTVHDRMNKRFTGKKIVDWYAGMDLKRAVQWGSQKKEVWLVGK